MNKKYILSMFQKYRTILRPLGTLVLLLLFQLTARATHIVGGSISYRCISKDVYEVTVVMRRDCFNGDPEAFFDNPASVGIFDRAGELISSLGTKGQLLLKLNPDDTLPTVENFCTLEGQRSVCVHETTYKGIISLPFRVGGYYLMYQRCCRNMPLQNIVDPLLTGASWVTYISEEAMTSCNSSPKFKQWAPIFACANSTFTLDHSATDADGDSLAYKLWTPFTGATKPFPKPQPPNKPDFNPVTWHSAYSESNMMGGDPFRIDVKTGTIFAVPNTLGLYVLGLKVEEYRKGKLIGTVYRDFEVKVIDCSNLIDAQIEAPALQCGNLTVNFKSNSQNAGRMQWFFDFDRNRNATSELANPTYQYIDTGFYKVALVINKDSSCFDTAFHVIHLKSGSAIKPEFTTNPGTCVNGNLTLFIIDQSTGLDPSAQYLWTITYNNQTITSALKNPVITIPNGVAATIKLDIGENGPGCQATLTKNIITSFIKPGDHKDQIDVCTGDTVKINIIQVDSIKGKYNYAWDPSPLILSGANTPEPVILSNVIQSIYLYVTVDNKNGCTSRDSVLIRSLPKPKLNFSFVNTCGSLAVKVVNQSDVLTNYLFNFGDGFTSTEREPSHTYAKGGNYIVTLSTTDGCKPSLSKTISLGNVCIALLDTIAGCKELGLRINPKANPIYSYIWRPTTKLSDLNIPNPMFIVDSHRTFIADLFDVNTGIGIGTHTIVVVIPVSDEIQRIKDTVLACAGQGVGLNPGGNAKLRYNWSPAQFLDNATAVNPIAKVDSTTRFTVVITNPVDSCVLSKQLVVIIPSKLAAAVIPDSLAACTGVGVNLNPNGKADPNLKYLWSPANLLDTATKVNPIAKISVPTTFTVTITDTRFSNCQTIETVKVSIPLIDELKKVKDSVAACAGVPVALNPGGDPGFKYEWTPATGLNNPNIANPIATINFTTTYTVKITDTLRGGCFATKPVKAIILLDDAIKDIKDTVVACSGQGIGLNPTGNPALKYTWSPAQFLNDANAANPIATVTQTTIFTVTIGDIGDSCAAGSKQVVVVLPAKLALDLIPDSLQACVSVPINLNPNGKADPNLKYQWTPANVLDDATKFNPVATITQPTVFTVTITDIRFVNCQISKTVKVSIPLVDEINKVRDSLTVCAGITTPLNPTGDTRFTYQWTPATGLDNPNLANPRVTIQATTIYTVTITDTQRGNCKLSKQVKVIVPPAFTVVPAFRDSINCNTNIFRLRVSSNSPRVTFEWFNPAGTSIGKGDTISVSPTQRTTFRVIGTDEFGCQKSDTVRVDPAAVRIGITVPGGGLVCQGDSIRLQVNNLNPNQVLTYVWTPTTEITSGANTATPVIRPTASRTYYVVATNAQGCTTRDSAVIKFGAVQNITVTATPPTIVISQSSQITATIVPGYTYSWTPVTGLNNPNIPNPVATPTQTITYRLTATSPDGCVQIREVTITVTVLECARPNIFLPNAFTPNGDGKNDVLYLRGVIVDRMSIMIYDRWGERVFESTNQSVGWDGTFRGKLLPPDVYGYFLVVDCIGGDRLTEQGNVTLLK